MRTLCLGGSFNPPHLGHQAVVESALRAFPGSRVLLVPTGDPYHKPHANQLAPATERLTLCKLMSAGRDNWGVSRVEIDRQGPSYTYDTVCQLQAQGHHTICWLIGADWLARLPSWHRFDQLRQRCQFVVFPRPGFDLSADLAGVDLVRLDEPHLDISSSEIRRRIRQGLPVDHLLPPAVARYIQTRGLYRDDRPPAD